MRFFFFYFLFHHKIFLDILTAVFKNTFDRRKTFDEYKSTDSKAYFGVVADLRKNSKFAMSACTS